MQLIKRRLVLAAALAAVVLPVRAQLGMFSKEQRIDLTRAWQGERFADGRPKVPDEVIQRLRTVTAEEAWGVLRSRRFNLQFEAGWQVINPGPEPPASCWVSSRSLWP